MKVSVWDTYVKRQDGKTLHFDILVSSELKDEKIIFDFGKKYLETKQFQTVEISSNECKFCHIGQASDAVINSINKNGFYIIEMENCN